MTKIFDRLKCLLGFHSTTCYAEYNGEGSMGNLISYFKANHPQLDEVSVFFEICAVRCSRCNYFYSGFVSVKTGNNFEEISSFIKGK